MHHSEKFQRYGEFDVSNILSLLEQTSDWLKDSHRQDTWSIFKHTQSIPLIDAPATTHERQADWVGQDLYWRRIRSAYYDACEPIIAALEQKHNGIAFKSFLVKLSAGSSVPPHLDGRPIYHLIRRHHIPIVTNPDVKFIIENQSVHMAVGECWEVDNTRSHEVRNDGSTDRIHLQIDIFPNDRKDNCEPGCKACNLVRNKHYNIFFEDYLEF